MKVPLLDLRAQYATIKAEVDAAVAEVIESQQFILGEKVEECERAIAVYSNCAHGVGVSSGSDALLVCLMAENIGPGDEVITSPYSFFATAGAVSRVGATPVFADIDPGTYNIDTNLIEARITDRTRAIIPVHLFGQMADMDSVMPLADRYGLVVIEDAAQAIGADYAGRRAGSAGHYGCVSFFPSKNLGCAGDGGMVVTNDDERAGKVRCLRNHGAGPKYYHKLMGGNFRLDAIQAAIVSAKLPHLDAWTLARQQHAKRYNTWLTSYNLPIQTPAIPSGRHIFNQYVIRTVFRDELRTYLSRHEVGTEIYYPVPLHLQECFSYLGYSAGDFPESEKAAKETLALPIFPDLEDSQAEFVAQCLREFFKSAAQAGQSAFAGRLQN